jgi:L-lactate dehydrogenase complex protein LldE
MDVHLFVPCYVDQVHPEVAMATVSVLRHAGCTVHFDARQTCCGQPMSNSGCREDAAGLARRHLDLFAGTTSVCPSGSCTSMVRHHFHDLGLRLDHQDEKTLENTFELAEFLVNVLGITDLGARFPHTVALHQSCHGLRELGLGTPSERREPEQLSPSQALLQQVEGLRLVIPERRDECCGFGGTFAVAEADLSARMGQDRCDQLAAGGAEYMTGNDMSCLMHLDGIRRRRNAGPKAIHLAEILACR